MLKLFSGQNKEVPKVIETLLEETLALAENGHILIQLNLMMIGFFTDSLLQGIDTVSYDVTSKSYIENQNLSQFL